MPEEVEIEDLGGSRQYITAGSTTGAITYSGAYHDVVWNRWVTNTAYTTTTSSNIVYPTYQQELEELRRQQAYEHQRRRDEEYRLEREASRERERYMDEEREAARQRGRELLRVLLTEEERAYFDRNRALLVTGSRGGKYEIKTHSIVGNVLLHAPEERSLLHPVASLCAHLQGDFPMEDSWAAQVLGLKTNEFRFHIQANVYTQLRDELPIQTWARELRNGGVLPEHISPDMTDEEIQEALRTIRAVTLERRETLARLRAEQRAREERPEIGQMRAPEQRNNRLSRGYRLWTQ